MICIIRPIIRIIHCFICFKRQFVLIWAFDTCWHHPTYDDASSRYLVANIAFWGTFGLYFGHFPPLNTYANTRIKHIRIYPKYVPGSPRYVCVGTGLSWLYWPALLMRWHSAPAPRVRTKCIYLNTHSVFLCHICIYGLISGKGKKSPTDSHISLIHA
jgi:hypothetical protein